MRYDRDTIVSALIRKVSEHYPPGVVESRGVQHAVRTMADAILTAERSRTPRTDDQVLEDMRTLQVRFRAGHITRDQLLSESRALLIEATEAS